MTPEKQFSGTSKSHSHFDRKVGRSGESRIVAVSKVLPKDWRYIRMTVLKKTAQTIDIRFTKLLGGNNNNGGRVQDKQE